MTAAYPPEFPLGAFLTYDRTRGNLLKFFESFDEPLDPQVDDATLKMTFVNMASRLLESPIQLGTSDLIVSYQLDAISEYFVGTFRERYRELFETTYEQEHYTDDEKVLIEQAIVNALSCLHRTCPDLFASLFLFLSRIYVFSMANLRSASKFHCFGVTLTSVHNLPPQQYENFFFESLVHEAIHQLMYVDTVVNPVFASIYDMTDNRVMAVNAAFSLRPANLGVAFHSCVIAAVQIYLHLQLGHLRRARHLYKNYAVALERLVTHVAELEAAGQPVFLEEGRAWMAALTGIDWQGIRPDFFEAAAA